MTKIKSFVESEYIDLKSKLNTSYQNKDTAKIVENIENVKTFEQYILYIMKLVWI